MAKLPKHSVLKTIKGVEIVKKNRKEVHAISPRGTIYSPRQAKYIEYYYNPKSPTYANSYRSALKAGFSETYAHNLSNGAKKNWIDEVRALATRKMTTFHIVDQIQNVAMEARDDKDKLRALEMLAKMKGLFIDRSVNETKVTFVNSTPRPEPKRTVIDITPEES